MARLRIFMHLCKVWRCKYVQRVYSVHKYIYTYSKIFVIIVSKQNKFLFHFYFFSSVYKNINLRNNPRSSNDKQMKLQIWARCQHSKANFYRSVALCRLYHQRVQATSSSIPVEQHQNTFPSMHRTTQGTDQWNRRISFSLALPLRCTLQDRPFHSRHRTKHMVEAHEYSADKLLARRSRL